MGYFYQSFCINCIIAHDLELVLTHYLVRNGVGVGSSVKEVKYQATQLLPTCLRSVTSPISTSSPCGTPILIVAEVLVMSLLVLIDSGRRRSAVILRCTPFNRCWQTVDGRDLETRSYALIRSRTAMNLWLFKIVFDNSMIACSFLFHFVKPFWYIMEHDIS